MAYDTLILECPKCQNQFPVALHLGYTSSRTFGLENAPLISIAEANHESKEGRVICIHCKTSLYVEVVYAAKIRVKSMRNREGWKTV